MSTSSVILVIFVVFFVTLFIGIPIGVSLCLTMFAAKIVMPAIPVDIGFVFRSLVASIDTYPILAVPVFILCGNIMGTGGISKRLFDFISYFIGNLTAGLPMAMVITCLFYGAISGSSPATTAAVGAMTVPMLVDLGYDKKVVVSIVAIAGGLGVIIPPSIPFIWYGLTANESVSSLFLAGVIPGIVVGLCLCLFIYIYFKLHGEDKEKLHANFSAIRAKGFMGVLKESIWALLMPVIILGGIYSGIVTPTEAAAVATVYSVIIASFVYKTLKPQDYVGILKDTASTMAPLMLVIGAAMAFGKVLALAGATQAMTQMITSLCHNKVTFLLFTNLVFLFLGCVMDGCCAIIIFTPIFLPVAVSFGMNPIHFGCLMIVNLALGFVTPPVGLNLYVASSMFDVPVMTIAKYAAPMMLVFIGALLLITFVPALSLVLL